jgi:putative ABC transport system permease protein
MQDWKALVRARVAPLAGLDPAREADIVDELAQHVAEHYAELVATGVADREAQERALAPLDDPRRIAREIAGADRPRATAPVPPSGRGSPIAHVVRDVRYSLRLLRRTPGFAAAAIVTLALGIGANAAIFSVVRAVVLNPPPYRDPSHVIAFLNGKQTATPTSITSSSLPDYDDWRQQLTSFEGFGLLSGWTFNVAGLELPERVFGARVTGSLFSVLGTRPLLGRTIEPADDQPGGDEVVVLGYRVWQRLFGGDPSIVGRAVTMEGRPHIVIGVMPPRFRFPSADVELWAAIKDNMSGMPRENRFMAVVGRLKKDVTLATAQAEVDTLTAQLEAAYPKSNQGWRVRLVAAHDASVGDARQALLALSGAVGLVLLIACTNVANLLLARATSRRRETAIRIALGAGRGRVVSQWITENLVLALAGGACGVALAYAAVRLVVSLGPTNVPRLDETAVDATVLGFTFVVALLAGIVPGMAPVFRALHASSPMALKDGAGGYTTTGRAGTGAALIVCEVALAMTLAVAGALVLKSFARLTAVAPGFDPDRVLTLKVFLTPPRYRSVMSEKQYIGSALERIASLPGIETVAAVSQLPLGDPASAQLFEIDGRTFPASDHPSAAYRAISASYFDAMRIPVVRGRRFGDEDRESSPLVVVVNDAAARRYWGGQDPIGQRLRWATGIGTFDRSWHTVVGVVADVKSSGLDRPEPSAIYAPYTQRVFTWLRWNSFVVRTHGEPESYARAIRQELAKLDPQQPIFEVAPLDRVIDQSVAVRRFHTGLIDLFAALALALCAVGVYGCIGCWVAERTREIGVRMALGATRRAIRWMVVARAGSFTAIGIAIGIGLSVATSRLLSTLLFDVQPFDAATLATASLVVMTTGAAAAYIPARRASSVDPLMVMRGE